MVHDWGRKIAKTQCEPRWHGMNTSVMPSLNMSTPLVRPVVGLPLHIFKNTKVLRAMTALFFLVIWYSIAVSTVSLA